MHVPDRPRLLDPQRSLALLVGTSHYRSSELADLPAVRNNLDALAYVLTHPLLGGLPPGRCVVLPDTPDIRTVYRILRQHATAAEDTLLVYFAGHGHTGTRNELYLSLSNTEPHELPVSALPYDLVREVFRDSPAENRIVILDCCFAGRAIQDMSGTGETILSQLSIAGTYTLASTPANAVALAPAGATYTAFTGELLRLLHDGVPGGPELLTLNEIYRQLRHAMRQRGLPLPQQRTVGMADQLALTRNYAHTPPAHSGHPTLGHVSTGPSSAVDPPRTAASHSLIHPSATVPPPARRRRVGWPIAFGLLLVAILIWSTFPALRGTVDPTNPSTARASATSTFSSTSSSNPSTPPAPTTSPSDALIERLALPAQATYGKTIFRIISVKVGADRIVLMFVADNSAGDQELSIADCCALLEQPTGKLRAREPFDSGSFPGNFMKPIPAGSRVTGDVIFTDGGLDPTTTTLVVTLGVPSTVDRTVLQFKMKLTTGG